MTYLKIKGQEASSWLKMVTRKMKLEVLPDTVHKLSPPQARKNCFIWMGHLYGAFGPGTTCWPGGGSEMLSRGRGVKNGLQGGRLATCPPHAHLCPPPLFVPIHKKNPVNPIIVCSHKVPQEGTVQKVCEGRIEYVPYNYTMAY